MELEGVERVQERLQSGCIVSEKNKYKKKKKKKHNTTYPDSWDTKGAVLRGKFMAINANITKTKSNKQIKNKWSNLIAHLKALKKNMQKEYTARKNQTHSLNQ